MSGMVKLYTNVSLSISGSVPSTGASTQAMTSYLPEEISWGHRFERLCTNQRDDGKYLFDYTRFHAIQPVDTPTCSAAELSKIVTADNSRRASISHRPEQVNCNIVNLRSCGLPKRLYATPLIDL